MFGRFLYRSLSRQLFGLCLLRQLHRLHHAIKALCIFFYPLSQRGLKGFELREDALYLILDLYILFLACCKIAHHLSEGCREHAAIGGHASAARSRSACGYKFWELANGIGQALFASALCSKRGVQSVLEDLL